MKFMISFLALLSSTAVAMPIFMDQRDIKFVTFDPPVAVNLPLTQVFPTNDVYYNTIGSTINSNLTVHHPTGDPTDTVVPTNFNFVPCNSILMGYTQSPDLAIGHLELTSDPTKHLTINSPGFAGGQIPYLDVAYTHEDSSQFLQFWSYDRNTKVLTFLGKTNDPPSPSYTGPFGPALPLTGDETVKMASQSATTGHFYLG